MPGKWKIGSELQPPEEGTAHPMFSLDKVLGHSVDILFWYNFQTLNYDYLSDSIFEITGYTRDEIITRSSEWLIGDLHPDDKPAFLERFLTYKNNTQKKDTIEQNYRLRHKDGRTIWISEHTRIIRDSTNTIIAIIGCGRDITEQKQLQQQLAESERKYKELYRNAHAALYRTQISDGKLLECSAALADLLGYDSIDECLETHSSTGHHYVDKDRRQQLLDELQKNKRVENFSAQVRRKDGSTMWISISTEIFPEQGYIEGVLTNITASRILTETEMKILRIILTGKSNKEIANGLGRSIRTVEDHRARIMRKLEVDNAVDLTLKALENGIIPAGRIGAIAAAIAS